MTRTPEEPFAAKVHADVERPDTVLFGLTGRQVLILAAAALLLWTGWTLIGHAAPVAFLAAALPVAGLAFVVAVSRRDGQSLDRWLVAAIRHTRRPRRLVPAEAGVAAPPRWITTRGPRLPLPAPLRLPARGITPDGLIDLGSHGTVGLVDCTTVNFGLRSPSEQTGLIGAFARWLNSLDGPVQVLLRAGRVDLSSLADRIEAAAPALPHPRLEAAARAHVVFLDQLASDRELLHRQVTVAVRDTRSSAHTAHRAAEAARALVACDIRTHVLDGHQAAAALADCLTPGTSATTTGREVPQ
jgi:PrgI family protein